MNEKRSMADLGRMSVEEFREAGKMPVIVVLDNIRSGLNVGSIFRSCDAFRASKILCCGYTPSPPHREVLKSALGATETVDFEVFATTLEAIQSLKHEGISCYAVEQTANSIPLDELIISPGDKTALVFGNEVHGVSQDAINECSASIEISQFGTKHSLNVSVCAGIVLHHVSLQLNKK